MRSLPLSPRWTGLLAELRPDQVPDLLLVLVDPASEDGGDKPVHGNRVPGHQMLDEVRRGLFPLQHDHDVGERLGVLGVS